MRTKIPVLLLAALALTGCAASQPDYTLDPFQDCSSLRDHMVRMGRQELLWNGGGGLRGGGWGMSEDMALSDTNQGGMAPPSPDPTFSGTNTQEANVDEADLVKTDGHTLYAVSGHDVVISQIWPTESAAQLAVVPIDGAPQGIYLVDNWLITLSTLNWQSPSPRTGTTAWEEGGPHAVLTITDVTDPAHPLVVRETYLRGELKQSRRIDQRLYLVTHEDLNIWTDGSRREARAALDARLGKDWLPQRLDNVFVDGAWGQTSEPACACERTWAAELEGGTAFTTVQVLDLTDPLGELGGGAVVGHGDTVYASTEALYVAYGSWGEGPFGGWSSEDTTVLHKFDITGEQPEYRASAQVPGALPSQFGLSEHNGVLRVATTTWGSEGMPTSGVYTLEEDQGRMVRLGELDGLMPGETLTAARFIGDLGYLVTYEVQWGDPLITLDMSDANDPRYGGELHVPGFSSYLHPMDEGHLLAVGMTDEAGRWQLQASVFDVSDLSAPTLVSRAMLPASNSDSLNDHHAFNWYEPTQTLTIPSVRDNGSSTLEVLHADITNVTSIGHIDQPAAWTQDNAWCAGIRRSIILNDELVWAIGEGGAQVAALDAPGTNLATVPFTGTAPCQEQYW